MDAQSDEAIQRVLVRRHAQLPTVLAQSALWQHPATLISVLCRFFQVHGKLADTTVLTIAHRLSTIVDYDRIFVMANGGLVEQGKPASLLADEKSYFCRMAAELGPAEHAALMQRASGASVATGVASNSRQARDSTAAVRALLPPRASGEGTAVAAPKGAVWAVKPAGGLCNRLRTVIASLATTQPSRQGSQLVLVWPDRSAACPCVFAETFAVHPQLRLATDPELATLARDPTVVLNILPKVSRQRYSQTAFRHCLFWHVQRS